MEFLRFQFVICNGVDLELHLTGKYDENRSIRDIPRITGILSLHRPFSLSHYNHSDTQKNLVQVAQLPVISAKSRPKLHVTFHGTCPESIILGSVREAHRVRAAVRFMVRIGD